MFKVNAYPELAQNPDEFDTLGTFGVVANAISFGDPEAEKLLKELHKQEPASRSWADLEERLIKRVRPAYVRPIYAYIHGAVVLSTNSAIGAQHMGWDTMQVGFMWVTPEKVRKEFNCKRITKNVLAKVAAILGHELQAYQDYGNGAVVGWEVSIQDQDGKTIFDDFGFDTEEDALKCAYEFLETLDK